MTDSPTATDLVAGDLTARLHRVPGVPVIGLCGAQGSGKSTVAQQVVERLAAEDIRCVHVSLDAFYLSKTERAGLARTIHPLLATRGPPGTHDVQLGLSILQALRAGERVRVPVFDKLADDRLPEDRWTEVTGPVDVLLFEGWCVGARPQAAEALVQPVNALERDEDPDAVWRTYVNDALAGPYHQLFDQLDALIMLQAPAFDIVEQWRLQQETTNAGGSGRPIMNAAEIGRFIQYYERITREMLAKTPTCADLVVELDDQRRVVGVQRR